MHAVAHVAAHVVAALEEHDEASGSFTGSIRSMSWSISVKIAVFAPIPRARESVAMPAKSGFRRSVRNANFTSEVRFATTVIRSCGAKVSR